MALDELDKKIAVVSGKTITQNKKGSSKVHFELSFREIKHIRRCAYNYLRIHPVLDTDDGDNNLSKKVVGKFSRFGKGKRRISTKILKKKMENSNIEIICSQEECARISDLTIDHIRPLSADGLNSSDNLRYLCKRHHKIREIEYVLKRKKKEVEKMETQIEELAEQLKNDKEKGLK